MTFTPASASSLAYFLLIVVAVGAALPIGVYSASRSRGENASPKALRVFAGLMLWVGLTSAIVASGFLQAAPWPRIVVFVALCNAAALLLGLSRIGKTLAHGLPLAALIAFQGFRLPLELVLHSWAEQGVIPGTMTWTGSNFDIITGSLAVVLAPAAKRKAVAWFVNLVGIALLLNVMRVVAFSSPFPFAWDVDPPLQLALHLPYAWIVVICVAGAVLGHVVLTRALLKR